MYLFTPTPLKPFRFDEYFWWLFNELSFVTQGSSRWISLFFKNAQLIYPQSHCWQWQNMTRKPFLPLPLQFLGNWFVRWTCPEPKALRHIEYLHPYCIWSFHITVSYSFEVKKAQNAYDVKWKHISLFLTAKYWVRKDQEKAKFHFTTIENNGTFILLIIFSWLLSSNEWRELRRRLKTCK